jgi:diguanylate cyclase (GGDEF)-like protein/PAS domain S-box-containing protein
MRMSVPEPASVPAAAFSERLATVASLDRVRSRSANRAAGESWLTALVEHAPDLLLLVEEGGAVRFAAASSLRLLGQPPEELAGRGFVDLVHPDDIPRARAFLDELVGRPGVPSSPAELRLQHRDGTWRHVEHVGVGLHCDPAVGALVLHGRDVTDRKAFELQLSHQAFHDSLTGLANRTLFRDRVERALFVRGRDRSPCAVLFLDLDDFKTVNDSLGHVVGDQLLVAAAERLRACVRPADTVARLGGDEFGILLEDVDTVGAAVEVAERVIETLRAPLPLQGMEAAIRTSVGIAMSDAAGGTDELLRNADIAMYAAKRAGKGCTAVFEPRMHEEALERLALESDLRRALERGELVLHYQPIVALQSAEIVGVEALVRWQHAHRGLLLPSQFVALAEETGLIRAVGQWVVREACDQARRWHELDDRRRPLHLSVNLSAKQLAHGGLVADILEAVTDAHVDPRTLVLEITETAVMQDTEEAAETLRELKRLGARIAVDDFGTGYSSLRYLHDFPVDVLKVDKAFVADVWRDAQKAAFTGTIVELCRTLRLQALAEGVEQREQAHELRRLGCELGQGNYLSPPLPGPEITELLAWGRELDSYLADLRGAGDRRDQDWWHKALGVRV